MLNKLRQTAISKDSKYVTTQSTYLYHDDYQLFYRKGSVLVGLSGQGAERNIAPYDLTIPGTKYTTGDVLVEILTCERVTAGAGQVVVTMKNGAPVVLYPMAMLAGSGICGL